MLKIFDEITGLKVMKPQFWLSPRIPKLSATIDGKTPKRNPYPRPDSEETKIRKCGLVMRRAPSWARRKTIVARKRHQTRLAWRFFTRKSEPTP